MAFILFKSTPAIKSWGQCPWALNLKLGNDVSDFSRCLERPFTEILHGCQFILLPFHHFQAT